MNKFALLPLLCCLTGCFHWVDNGNGGLAEAWSVETESRHPLYQRNAQQLIETQFQMQELANKGALKVTPALMHQARMQWIRATREHSNHLNNAAHQQLTALNKSLRKIQSRMGEYQPVRTGRPGPTPL